jgi:hypothetical protein
MDDGINSLIVTRYEGVIKGLRENLYLTSLIVSIPFPVSPEISFGTDNSSPHRAFVATAGRIRVGI